MDTQIICPSCKKPIPISEALSHQMKESLEKERIKLQKEKEEYREKMMAAFKTRVDEERRLIERAQEEKMREHDVELKARLKKDLDLQMKDKANEAEELAKSVKELQEQLLNASKQRRQIQQEKEQMKIEMEKQLLAEEEKIKDTVQKRAAEEYQLKMMEKDKKIQDAMKMVEEYKRKLEQGSQQMQGEVLELHIGEILRKEFPLDTVTDVPKGKLGADLIQQVSSRNGQACGQIVWELKRTKVWSNDWVPKLKEDQRQLKAELAVIISDILPPDIKFFGLKEGVWVGSFQSVIGLATLLRKSLLDVALIKASSSGKKEKMEIMWEYLTSVEFKQRVEAIIEVFASIKKDIETERTWFQRKWEKQEKSIRKVIDNTAGMYGSLESIMGKALPEMEGLSLTDGQDDKIRGDAEVVTEKGTLF